MRFASVVDVEAWFGPIADALPHGLLLVDEMGVMRFVNQRLERQLGSPRETLVGQPVDRVLPGVTGQQRRVPVKDGASEPWFMAGEAQRRSAVRADGSELAVDVRVNSMVLGEGKTAMAVIVDVPAGAATDPESADSDPAGAFARLVGDLCATLLSPSAGDDHLRDALRSVGEALDLDRCRLHPVGTGAEWPSADWNRAGLPAAPAMTRSTFPFTLEHVQRGGELWFASPDEIPNAADRERYRSLNVRSAVVLPLASGSKVMGAISFEIVREERRWSHDRVSGLRVIASAAATILANRHRRDALQQALTEAERLRSELHEPSLYRPEARERVPYTLIVGQSPVLQRVFDQVEQVAKTGSTVLLLGETGTGKELFAARIHDLSSRRARPMVRVNCSAIPNTLMESELFGREKGAFTGAQARQIGRFEMADQSTIFLDEIGDLSMDIQVKLLRVLEERQIERLGNPRPIHVDTRIIAATHRDLEQRVAEGAFREDLFYRLNVFPVRVPPLRERTEDIPLLVWRFVEEFSLALGKTVEAIPRGNLEVLQRYHWPGNIRELRNVVERAMIVATTPRLTISLPVQDAPGRTLERLDDVEREHIRSVLEMTGWRIRGVGGAAERLGMRPTTLETRMAKLGLKRPPAR